MSTPRPWLAPYRGWLPELLPIDRVPAPLRLLRLNRWSAGLGLRTDSGHPLRFVDASAHPAHGPYETSIARSGAVPTRSDGPGAMHDLYNALAWLRFPRTKARLNAMQAACIEADGVGGRRGATRDALTLFDENALLWVSDEPGLTQSLRDFDWPAVFGALKAGAPVATWVFGHALLQKLDAPYKAITAHAWPVALPSCAALDTVDDEVATALSAVPPTADRFCPLPVMGLPGWCDDNERPGFYDDPGVFRSARRDPANPRARKPMTGDTT